MVLNYLFRRKPEYRTRKLLCFSKEQMYEVVADIENYSSFLPFCTQSNIVDQNQSELKVKLEIGFPPIKEKYTSLVTMNKPNLILAKSCDGELFEYLETVWKFTSVPQGDPMTCIVDFSIKFKFKSNLYTHVASVFFGKLVKCLETAFINEAVRRYGRSSTCIFEMTSQD
ncbi:coenzyme Q-binding protein COQ10 homolog B, mitochondrial-like [Diorhabda carinulata]|uniref:coenzyme Q-binding protein COQ10 homolog B, mitochondrial-like n=1 Tax=Diorhabda carinulata TaxID=1163345 RepID=UPI0025A1E7B5|nr:coenzyme Q-binding protein COQ10 homolog B, mitochondrial-like [Diorhabda carinulata]